MFHVESLNPTTLDRPTSKETKYRGFPKRFLAGLRSFEFRVTGYSADPSSSTAMGANAVDM
eukprot:scaffold21600_cov117-Cylindrotheca_fusiformis.AAC.1